RYEVGELLGVASVGQVHMATDRQSGAQVVLKFIKPNVSEAEIRQEFAFMEAYLKPYLDAAHPEQARYLRDSMTGFRDGIIEEIDFAQEGRNIQRFAQAYPDSPRFQGIELVEVADNRTVLVMK